jgi:uncharacterized protein (TIGR04222 family)
MNPFDLAGPQFLVFYLGLSALVIIGVVVARKVAESSSAPKLDLSDPYLIAYLRGGDTEMLRVAAVSLVDRGLLTATGTQLKRAENAAVDSVRRPVEKELLNKFQQPDEASAIFDDARLNATSKPYEQTLKNAGLLPNESIKSARLTRLLIACFVLGGFGVVKILVALSRGRTNLGFLIVLMIVAVAVAVKLSFPRLTESGTAMLVDLQGLYSDLKSRALLLRTGGATLEPVLLAAVFGVAALESADFAFTRTLFPSAQAAQAGSSWASGGSSCSSSSCSSSSCGSSCGGGCGGGCGGCGS